MGFAETSHKKQIAEMFGLRYSFKSLINSLLVFHQPEEGRNLLLVDDHAHVVFLLLRVVTVLLAAQDNAHVTRGLVGETLDV